MIKNSGSILADAINLIVSFCDKVIVFYLEKIMSDFETLADLFTSYNAEITATETEIAAWKILDPVQREYARLMSGRLSVAEDNKVLTRVGLFGADLTDFNADCVLLEDLCDVTDYADYNGWGVGVNWESEEAVADDQRDGVAFSESKWTVQVTWSGIDDANVIRSGISDVAIAADAPIDSEANLEAAVDAFDAWAAEAGTNAAAQFTFAFFEVDSEDFYFEAGDTASVWATFGADPVVDGNVETAAFEFVGAASLTAATSVIVAALLF
jgi:hypothetical protein